MVAGAVAAQNRGGLAGPDGARVLPIAACWWQMVRGGAASLVLEAKARSRRHPRPHGDGLLPVSTGS